MITVLVVVLRVVLAVRLLYLGRRCAAWTLPGAAALAWWGVRTGSSSASVAALVFAAVAAGIR